MAEYVGVNMDTVLPKPKRTDITVWLGESAYVFKNGTDWTINDYHLSVLGGKEVLATFNTWDSVHYSDELWDGNDDKKD